MKNVLVGGLTCLCSYREIAHDALSAADGQGDVEWSLTVCGLIVHPIYQIQLRKLYYAIGITKFLNLSHSDTYMIVERERERVPAITNKQMPSLQDLSYNVDLETLTKMKCVQ